LLIYYLYIAIVTVIPNSTTMSLTGLDKDYELKQSDTVHIRCSSGCSFPNGSFVLEYVVRNCQLESFQMHQIYADSSVILFELYMTDIKSKVFINCVEELFRLILNHNCLKRN